MTRDEIRDALGVSEGGLKTIIKRNTLNDRLENVGLQLVNEYKSGRNTIYELNPLKLDYWDMIQNHYNVKKKIEQTVYTCARLDGGLGKSRASILKENDINISGNTAKRFDDILENEGMIALLDTKTIRSIVTDAHNVVYRIFDKNNSIIYIGKSNDLVKRMNGHSCEEKENDWFNKEVDRIEYITFNAYGDCSIAEMYFITKVKPRYNKDFITWETSINIDMFDNMIWNIAEIEEDEINVYGKGENYDRVIRLLKDRTKVDNK